MSVSDWSVMEDLKAIAVDVAEGELGAGMRDLAAADRPCALGPGAELELAEFRDIGAVTLLTVLAKSGRPRLGRQGENRRPHRSGEVEADREAQLAFAHRVDQLMGGAGGVGAHQDRL